MCRHYIGRFAEARAGPSAFAAPTTNATADWCRVTRRRSNLVYSQRTAALVCAFRRTPTAPKRVAWSSARRIRRAPILAFSAMLMAGLEGVDHRSSRRSRDRRGPVRAAGENGTGDWYEDPEQPRQPGEVLDALEGDRIPVRGGVFTQDVIDEWISFKREREIDAGRPPPHPYEFHLYYDI